MKYPDDFIDKVICGDCLKILPLIPDNSVDLIVTSPPYNLHNCNRKINKNYSWKNANIDYGVFKDDMPENEYQEWQKKILKECIRVLKEDGSIFYNHKPRINNHRIIFPHEWLSEFIIRQMIIWDRGNSPIIEPIRFLPTVEYVFWITKKQKTPKINSKYLSFKEVWRINPAKNNPHPAPFPEELVSRCINATTTKDDIVLDPFLGSGTTAVACKKLQRHFIGIEINPEYCKMAEERLNKIPNKLSSWWNK